MVEEADHLQMMDMSLARWTICGWNMWESYLMKEERLCEAQLPLKRHLAIDSPVPTQWIKSLMVPHSQ